MPDTQHQGQPGAWWVVPGHVIGPSQQDPLSPPHLQLAPSQAMGSRDLGACAHWVACRTVGLCRGLGPWRLQARPKVSQGSCFPAWEAGSL